MFSIFVKQNNQWHKGTIYAKDTTYKTSQNIYIKINGVWYNLNDNIPVQFNSQLNQATLGALILQ